MHSLLLALCILMVVHNLSLFRITHLDDDCKGPRIFRGGIAIGRGKLQSDTWSSHLVVDGTSITIRIHSNGFCNSRVVVTHMVATWSTQVVTDPASVVASSV
jgi:hypothetical protein